MCNPLDAIPHILEEPNNEQWFLAQGFRIEVEAEKPGHFWTHLVHQNNEAAIGRLRRYGHGTTTEDSIKNARQRYEVEQLGIGPSSWSDS
jgi:hypothetical protein